MIVLSVSGLKFRRLRIDCIWVGGNLSENAALGVVLSGWRLRARLTIWLVFHILWLRTSFAFGALRIVSLGRRIDGNLPCVAVTYLE